MFNKSLYWVLQPEFTKKPPPLYKPHKSWNKSWFVISRQTRDVLKNSFWHLLYVMGASKPSQKRHMFIGFSTFFLTPWTRNSEVKIYHSTNNVDITPLVKMQNLKSIRCYRWGYKTQKQIVSLLTIRQKKLIT